MQLTPKHYIWGGLAALLLVLLMLGYCGAPRNDRDWYPYLSRTNDAEMSDTGFSVTPVSDWSYGGPDVVDSERYRDAAFDFSDLRNVWFVLEPQPGSDLAAHTLLLFEFTDDRLLGITIEARRERNEDYSAVRGVWNSFELSYIWASARDLLTRRAVMLEHEVFIYPVAITDDQERVLIQRLLQRTIDLETRPRFYNTLFSNCTNELAKATDIDWHYSFILTGVSDNHLFDIGLIPGESFELAHERSDMTAFIAQLNAAPEAEFDRALLTELRRRFGN